MWDLSCPPRDRTHISCSGRQSLSHCTAREVPTTSFHKSRNIIASCGNYCRIQIFLPNALFYLKLPTQLSCLIFTYAVLVSTSASQSEKLSIALFYNHTHRHAHSQTRTLTTIESRKVTVTLFHFLCTPASLMIHHISQKSGYLICLSLTKKALCCSDLQQGWQVFSVKGQAVSVLNIAGHVDDFSAQPL